MRRFTLLALMAIITAPVFGYGGKALNDDIYVDIFCDTYMLLEDEAELAQVLEDYNTTIDAFDAYTEELIDDPARAEAVSEAISEKDAFAGMAFGLAVSFSGWDDGFWEDLEPWRYFSPELTVIPDDWDYFSDGEKQEWFAQEFAWLREQFLEWQQEVMSQDTLEE